jgi:transposase
MGILYYVGLDVHKKTVAYCIKLADGSVVGRGSVAATRIALSEWAQSITHPWIGAMEATIFTRWIYEHLVGYAREIKVAHPAKLEAISCSKKKSDRHDAQMLADLLRCDLLPSIYMVSKPIYDLRQQLRYRNTLVRNAVQARNKMAGLLMESGNAFDRSRMKGKKYFNEVLANLEDDTPESVKQLLKHSRSNYEIFQMTQKRLIAGLRSDAGIKARVDRLMSIGGAGEILALTWALEVGDPSRFRTLRQALSYCGLTSAQEESAGKSRRGPLSKKRNANLQTMLVEAAKLAPRYNPQLKAIYEKQVERGHENRATIMVARKLVSYLMAVDKSGQRFELREAA